MASGPSLPPQAYTREILTAAFNWLQTQPDSVRKVATTPDALVGLFTRAKRFGNSSLEADAPVSSQSFMSDLKILADGLKQFESPREDHRRPQTYQQPVAASLPLVTPLESLSGALNDRSWTMIQEVKGQLNLTSDAETVNMMVALAYKSLKNLLA